MAIRITLRCDRCGSPARGDAWVVCTSCGTLCGFDFTRWMESDQWLAFTRRAMADPAAYQQRWARHEEALTDAAKAEREGRHEAALERAAAEAQWLIGEMPTLAPPRASEDPELRRRYAHWIGFELLHARLGGRISDLYAKLNKATAALGFGANEDPMPRVRDMLDVLRELLRARYELGSPPDPEGLTEDARFRVLASVLLTAYVRLISPELQGEILRTLYGEGVEVSGTAAHDYSLYFDWECPQCGLFSLQGHGVEMMTCPGCFCSRRFNLDALKLGALAQPCPSCGARVDFGAGETDARCGFCTTVQRRFAATGAAQRILSREVRQLVAAQHGLPSEMPEQQGLGVTPQSRLQRQAEGIARMAQWFHPFITPARLAGLARTSAGVDVSSVFNAARQIVEREGPPKAINLLTRAQGLA